jgi:hypothetical protein
MGQYLDPATDLSLVPKVFIAEFVFQVFLFPRDDADLQEIGVAQSVPNYFC